MPDIWTIPAKTFLVGEYAALTGQSALLVTTTPCFELRKATVPGLQGIHLDSPAGRWWTQSNLTHAGFTWHDPYAGLGGLGASSAQFLAVYLACAHIRNQLVEPEALLHDYQKIATQPGIQPSGYDVLAQYTQGCVYLNRQKETQEKHAWPFADIGFILVHSQKKLATHEHLQSLMLSSNIDYLSDLVDHARAAFLNKSSYHLIEVVKAYHQALCAEGWVANHTLNCIQRLYQETNALAIKGCGAMGADVILLIVKQAQIQEQIALLNKNGWQVLASHEDVMGKTIDCCQLLQASSQQRAVYVKF